MPVRIDENTLFWEGKPLEELSRDELIKIIKMLVRHEKEMTAERCAMIEHLDYASLLEHSWRR